MPSSLVEIDGNVVRFSKSFQSLLAESRFAAPLVAYHIWTDELSKLRYGRPEDVRDRIGDILRAYENMRNEGHPDEMSWRSALLAITLLIAEDRSAGCNFEDHIPRIQKLKEKFIPRNNRDPDLGRALGSLLEDLYAIASKTAAGPVAYYCVANATAPCNPAFRNATTAAYFDALTADVPPATGSNDPVLSFLLTRLATPRDLPSSVPHNHWSWVERTRILLGGRPHWLPAQLIAFWFAIVACVALTLFGMASLRQSYSREAAFRGDYILPFERAFGLLQEASQTQLSDSEPRK